MTDHTPSPATDGLREAIEALADRLEAPATKMQIISADPAPSIRQVIGAKLRAILAAHPAAPSEPATERCSGYLGAGETCGKVPGHPERCWEQVEETQPQADQE